MKPMQAGLRAHDPARGNARRRGFTLMEVMVAGTLFTMLGYALTEAVRVADTSHSQVTTTASTNRALRETTTQLLRELKTAQADSLTVTAGFDGNQEVTFAHPITVAGNPAWGVHDRRLGADPADQSQAGWRLRYTVRDVDVGTIDRRLVRQVLDDVGQVRLEDVLLGGLASGPNPPGFTLAANGDVWEATVRTEGEGQDHGRESVFQIRMRN